MHTEHPCFNGACAGTHARVHLPVAPACNIQCNYCKRAFDCVNESRPGVTSTVLSPPQALERYLSIKKIMNAVSVVGIAGPGDPLANIDAVLETLRLIRDRDRDVLFCISTNGLMLPRYARALFDAGVTHLTVTINAAREATAARIYKHIDYDGKRIVKLDAARLLLENQIEGLRAAAALGMLCKVNMVCVSGLNERELPELAARVKEAGASLANIMQHIPVKGTLFESLPMISRAALDALRKECEARLPQMYHCRQCRADAAGLLGCDLPSFAAPAAPSPAAPPPAAAPAPLLFAVATKGGVLVDEHFGHAREFAIYEYARGAVRLREKRPVAPFCSGECGSNNDSMPAILAALRGCAAVLSLRIGEAPRAALARHGIRAVMTCDYIENAVREAGG